MKKHPNSGRGGRPLKRKTSTDLMWDVQIIGRIRTALIMDDLDQPELVKKIAKQIDDLSMSLAELAKAVA